MHSEKVTYFTIFDGGNKLSCYPAHEKIFSADAVAGGEKAVKKWKRKTNWGIRKLRKAGVSSKFDVLGSYTGTPVDGEEPVQDADDL